MSAGSGTHGRVAVLFMCGLCAGGVCLAFSLLGSLEPTRVPRARETPAASGAAGVEVVHACGAGSGFGGACALVRSAGLLAVWWFDSLGMPRGGVPVEGSLGTLAAGSRTAMALSDTGLTAVQPSGTRTRWPLPDGVADPSEVRELAWADDERAGPDVTVSGTVAALIGERLLVWRVGRGLPQPLVAPLDGVRVAAAGLLAGGNRVAICSTGSDNEPGRILVLRLDTPEEREDGPPATGAVTHLAWARGPENEPRLAATQGEGPASEARVYEQREGGWIEVAKTRLSGDVSSLLCADVDGLPGDEVLLLSGGNWKAYLVSADGLHAIELAWPDGLPLRCGDGRLGVVQSAGADLRLLTVRSSGSTGLAVEEPPHGGSG